MILQRFESAAAASQSLAEQVAGALRNGLALRRKASLAVPGGRTPGMFFRALSGYDLDWPQIDVTLTDERWVPDHHPASNAALVRTQLLTARATPARFFPLHNAAASAQAGADEAWHSLQPVPRPFDAVVLGMGDDGHFASLFPGSPGLATALDAATPPGCVAMVAPTEPVDRISLNLAALLQCRRLFLLITGMEKRELLLNAARRAADAPLPIAALLSQRAPLPEVYWAP